MKLTIVVEIPDVTAEGADAELVAQQIKHAWSMTGVAVKGVPLVSAEWDQEKPRCLCRPFHIIGCPAYGEDNSQ